MTSTFFSGRIVCRRMEINVRQVGTQVIKCGSKVGMLRQMKLKEGAFIPRRDPGEAIEATGGDDGVDIPS